MRHLAVLMLAVGLLVSVVAPAHAEEPTSREVQAAVDAYLESAQADPTLVGGPGSAGYDQGFWIRGGDALLRINLTLQARFEWFDYDKDEEGRLYEIPGAVPPPGGAPANITVPWPGGDLSGFSLPRATLKFSGEAPCKIRYYAELEFGHPGASILSPIHYLVQSNPGVFLKDPYNYSILREAWVEWAMADAFNVRMGQVMLPSTRQLMVAPELQQFADLSMAASLTGALLPGYTDRPRDYGLLIHGMFGCRYEWQYMFSISNGDGADGLRNVLNPLTSDNLAYGGRLNWTFGEHIGYQEGALNHGMCKFYGELGAWGNYYADRVDGGGSGLWPHTALYDRLMTGLDLALGYGGFSFTSAFTYAQFDGSGLFLDEEWLVWLVQAGYHFPGTAFELGARWSSYVRTISAPGGNLDPTTDTFAVAINYYLNGHANKLTVDGTYVSASSDGLQGGGWYDMYAGVPLGFNSSGDHVQLRFQWQLAL